MLSALHRIGAGVSWGFALIAWTLGHGGLALLFVALGGLFYLGAHE